MGFEEKYLNRIFNVFQLMYYLYHRGRYANNSSLPHPHLILLDLNMPRISDLEALKEIKTDLQLRRIPIVILSISRGKEDIYNTYDLGANSFITKPVTFASLVEVMKTLVKYWFEIVKLPLEAVGEKHGQQPYQSSVH
ncbi:response regulator [Nostoc sp.]|uniref:response regulator n=1 Tax=Nostoc sp. TaxID=1180 RepID=UPI003FA55165